MYDIITENLTDKNFTEKKLQIDSKWSETRKKHKTADASPVAITNWRWRF